MDQFPTPEEFFLDIPPYLTFPITDSNYQHVLRLEYFSGAIDTFCTRCNRTSVVLRAVDLPPIGPAVRSHSPDDVEEWLGNSVAWFPSVDDADVLSRERLDEYAYRNRNFTAEFACTRDSSHLLFFAFRVQDSSIRKFGQYPSLADLQGNELRRYRRVLSAQRFRELNRAVGLSAHGVGIGSFVYLRRIIEELIEKAHAQATEQPDWDEEDYAKSRVVEKVKMLKSWLPAFLVENSSAYSILSKGIHSLHEQECLDCFSPLKLAIELILDEELEKQEREKKIASVSQDLAKLKGGLR